MRKIASAFVQWVAAICLLLIHVAASAQCYPLDFHEQPLGTTSTTQPYTWTNLTNRSDDGPPRPQTISSITVNNPPAIRPCGFTNLTNDYAVGGTCVEGLVLLPGASCTVSANFAPQAIGQRYAYIALRFTDGNGLDFELRGNGVASGFSRPTVPVVEYHNAALNQYVTTSAVAEIAALDAGAIKGWVRSGATFEGFASDSKLTRVCRYYAVTTSASSSHWYFFNSVRCGLFAFSAYANSLVELVPEDYNVFSAVYPSASGWCPYATIPLYAFWDRSIGHRYTTDPVIRANMFTQGWIAEGYGQDAVIACVSQ